MERALAGTVRPAVDPIQPDAPASSRVLEALEMKAAEAERERDNWVNLAQIQEENSRTSWDNAQAAATTAEEFRHAIRRLNPVE